MKLSSHASGRASHLPLILWIVFFCYAICAALIFQKILLPLIPSLHAVGGLVSIDSVYFDSVAWTQAEQIHQHGWSSWQLFPATDVTGNVAILGALYAVFGHDPTLIIPINAAMHALGGVLIFLLARELSSEQSIATYAGLIAAFLFVIYPSALNWYGQLHKDGYAIAGNLLIVLVWVKAARKKTDMRGWLSLLLAHFVGVMLVAIVRPYNLLTLLHVKGVTANMEELTSLLGWALPILLFSGMVILGNSVLNANGRAVLSSSAQLVVPLIAILAFMLFGERYGIKVVMFGMVAGQVLNLLIVQHYLKQHEISLLPKPGLQNQDKIAPLMAQYFPMVATAFFVSIGSFVATILAMSLPEGGVSAFNLGNKVVLFVTGLVGTVITAAILPYFSDLVSKNHLVEARRELSVFLLCATFISVPICTALFIWSEPIVHLLFERGTFNSSNTEMVARVMQYAVVQLPFFVCNSLLLKFATATKHVMAICPVAIFGLLVNIAASIILMKHMNVAGIALGSTVSMIMSTLLLVMVLVRYWHITWLDAIIMMMNWLLFITLLVCVHFGSMPSIIVTSLAYLVLLAGYFESLSNDRALRFGVDI